MRIPAKCDYALRALVAIAPCEDDLVRTEMLATSEGIPFAYLQNILVDLRRAGLLTAQRGYDGGYQLARPASSIAASEVLEAVESPLTEPYEGAAQVWGALDTSTRGLLESTTLADLVR
jgi:Rrf2 family protein